MRVPAQHDSTNCRAVADVLARVGDKWTVMVVAFLSGGPMRFNELRRTIGGISQRMLTLTLRGLERDGLVTRTVTPSIPPRVDYELTELGRTLIATLGALSNWAIRNRLQVEEARRRFDGRDEPQPAGPQASGTLADRAAAAPPTR
jgi:DNA-binding HxlR family transcriptional regulator